MSSEIQKPSIQDQNKNSIYQNSLIDPTTPLESIHYNFPPSTQIESPMIRSVSNSKKKISCPPTKNIFHPELFLDQN